MDNEERKYYMNIVEQVDDECCIYNIMESHGMGFVRCTAYNGDMVMQISDLVVNPNYRRRKVATQLIEDAICQAQLCGRDFVELKVLKDSWMELWYKKLGFKLFSNEGKYNWMVKCI